MMKQMLTLLSFSVLGLAVQHAAPAYTNSAPSTTYSEPTASTALPSASPLTINNGKNYIIYSTVKGFFLQDETTTNATSFNYTTTNFGLINRTYGSDPAHNHLTQWERFNRKLFALNQEAAANVAYKLLFIGRHGEGYHNAAQTYYGTPGWNCYYAELDGNDTSTWSDAHLDANGIAQAELASAFWTSLFKTQKIQAPQSYYVSPLTRCLQTAQITYGNLSLPAYYPFIPTVKEYLREGISIHTCDRRSSRSYIAQNFPGFNIEPTMSEDDELWNGITSESSSAQDYRSKYVLDEIFASDPSTIISITTHSGEAAAMLVELGHIPFSLNTGEILPVLVRAETKAAPAPATSTVAWAPSSWCPNGPPKTSQTVSPYACVCKHGVKPTATTARITKVPKSLEGTVTATATA